MSYGTAISQALPAVLSAEPAAATALKAWCDEVEARVEAKVTPAGFLMNADLDCLTTYGVNNAQHVNLAAASGTKTGAGNAGKLYRYNKELYYTNSDGTTVRLTNAGAIDITSIRGIQGDYSADGNCQIDYTTATTLYRCLSNLSNLARAIVEVGYLRVYGTGNNPSYHVEMRAPTLSATYNFALPTGLPGSTSLLQWTAAGQMQSTRDPSIDTLAVGLTSTFTGKATFVAEVAHPSRKLMLPATCGEYGGGGSGGLSGGTHYAAAASPGGDGATYVFGIPAQVGWTVASVEFHIVTSATAGTRTYEVGHYNPTAGMAWPGGSYDATFSTTGTTTTLTLTINKVVTSTLSSSTMDGLMYARWTMMGGDEIYGITVNYSRV
jgi:hypothetical protein